ncbi:MAG: CIA30 family protein [Pseudomonadota bacterium]
MARDYIAAPETPWAYVSDQVMGGVSEGQAAWNDGALRLAGQVSTANRGGFIQVRTRIDTPIGADAAGLVLDVRGNGERYFVHLRTRGTILPWQYYQAGFETAEDWQRVRLPFSEFAPSGRGLRGSVRPETVVSIGLAAFGRDHAARVELRSLEIY